MRLTQTIVGAALVASASASLYGESKLNHTCGITDADAVRSCSANAIPSKYDSCCVETYGGLFLATQFWSTYTGLESQGQLLPPLTWTIHGLWPDFCNGSYTQYCDLSRQYDPVPSPNTTNGLPNGTVVPAWKGPGNITTFLQEFGKYDLLAYMNKYWINQGAPNDDFWAHEFSKHATCFSTFDTECYGPKYQRNQELADFFETAILYYRRLPTYGWLSAAGIRPTNATNAGYTLSALQSALYNGYGALPYIGCSGPRYNETAAGANSTDNGRTVLSETWYNFYAYGRPQRGQWSPVNATGSVSNCAKASNAIRYYQMSPGSVANSVAPGPKC